jgi:uncharacterized protein DUF3574
VTARRAALWLVCVLLSGCGAPRCQPGAGQAMQIYDLYFGRSVTGRAEVSDKEWREFREQVVTPALPDGYTVLDGQGAWMNPRSRATISEATKILVVALPDAPESLTTINRIRGAWQRRFHQYVVGMTVQSGRGSFSPAEPPR